ncbi:MAG: hypothetical protein RLZZ555_721 [Pseudomonadota bacterium]|jgi:NAD-dependent dihydropyrimidine dehydrogenase PreA subunit
MGDAPDFAALRESGLNLSHVFDLAALPPELLASLAQDRDGLARYRQLILLGHLGRDFWAALRRRGLHGSDPVDQFVGECVAGWMADELPGRAWLQVFPGSAPVALQRLGQLAGWHHASPFGVGVDPDWGSWFAYRAVLLADTELPVTPRRATASPCEGCVDKPCIGACPAGALSGDRVGLGQGVMPGLRTCLSHRLQAGSGCADRCLARKSCPVGARYRYDDGQIAYHYLHSLRFIREHG